MNTQFDFTEQNGMNYTHNQFNHNFPVYSSSPFQMYNRSPFQNQNNPPTSHRLRKSINSNNGNIFQQPLPFNQNFHPINGSNFSQFYNDQRISRDKYDDQIQQKHISNFDNTNDYDEDNPYTKYFSEYSANNLNNNNNNNYANTSSPFMKKSSIELNVEMQQHDKMNRNGIIQSNFFPHNNFYNPIPSLNNNSNINNNINNNNNFNTNTQEQVQKTGRGRGRPRKNPTAPPAISKQIKKTQKKRKQSISSGSEVDFEIEKQYEKEVQKSSGAKNSIDSMKAEEESLDQSDEMQSHSQTNNTQNLTKRYQITTRGANKQPQRNLANFQLIEESDDMEDDLQQNHNDQPFEKQIMNQLINSSTTKNDANRNTFYQSNFTSSSNRKENQRSENLRVCDIQQIGNLIPQGINGFSSPGSIQQIKKKFIEQQQKNKSLFQKIHGDNLFPSSKYLQQQPKFQPKVKRSYQKRSKLIEENEQADDRSSAATSTEISSNINEQNNNNNQHKKVKSNSLTKKIEEQDSKNTSEINKEIESNEKGQTHSTNNSEQQKKELEQQKKEVEDQEKEEKLNQSKLSTSSKKQTNNKTNPKVNESRESSICKDEKSNNNEDIEFAVQSTTLNSIIHESSLKNLNKKYLQSTKKSNKINSSKMIMKKQCNKQMKHQPQYNKPIFQKPEHGLSGFSSQMQPQHNMNNNQVFTPMNFLNKLSKMSNEGKSQAIDELNEEQRDTVILKQLSELERYSFLYANVSKYLLVLHNNMKQKYYNTVFYQQKNHNKINFNHHNNRSNGQSQKNEEYKLFQNLCNINFNKSNEYPQMTSSLHNIIPSHLMNGSFPRMD